VAPAEEVVVGAAGLRRRQLRPLRLRLVRHRRTV